MPGAECVATRRPSDAAARTRIGHPACVRDLLPELVRDAADPTRPMPGMQAPGHVALSACDEWAVAERVGLHRRPARRLQQALGRALARLGRDATYRQVLSDARCRVEGRFRRQVPTLEAVGDLADQVFLRGALRPRSARVTLRRIRRSGRWTSGRCTASSPTPGSPCTAPSRSRRFASPRCTRTQHRRAGRTGRPTGQRQYDMVLTDTPLPPVAVSIQATPDVVTRLTKAVRSSGPGRGPSPHIRLVPPGDEPSAPLLLRVWQAEGGRTIQLTSADHEPLAPRSTPTTTASTRRSGTSSTSPAGCRYATWPTRPRARRRGPDRGAAGAAGRARPSRDRAPLPAGNLEFTYSWTGTTWKPPSVFIRLRNTTDRKLYCILLDLTDQHRMHADLFPGEYVAARWTAEVGLGGPVTLSLPPHRPVEPGASVTDWLVLLVAEEPFSSDPFALPRLRTCRGTRSEVIGVASPEFLDRLGLRAVHRDVVPAPGVALDWGVKVVEVTTSVPAGPSGEGGTSRSWQTTIALMRRGRAEAKAALEAGASDAVESPHRSGVGQPGEHKRVEQ